MSVDTEDMYDPLWDCLPAGMMIGDTDIAGPDEPLT
jgi:hypothetical protein